MSDIATNPDSVPSLLDDDTLNESERAFIEAFERRGTNSSDAGDGTAASAEDEVDPLASPPGAQPDSSAAPVPPTQIEGSEPSGTENDSDSTHSDSPDTGAATSEGDDDGEGGAGSGSTSPPPAPAFTFAGQNYSQDDLARAVQVAAWHQNLSDQQVVAIDALLSGQYRLVPANEAAPVPPGSPVAPATPANSPASTSSTAPGSPMGDNDAGEWLDPRAEQEITALRNQLSELQSSVQQQVSPLVQQQLDASMQQRLAAIDSATQSFAKDFSLDEAQVNDVMTAAAQAQILPSLLQRHNGDMQAATRAALDMMFWTTPSFREPYVAQRTAADLAALSEQERAGKVKQQQMTALSASGGSVPRRDPKPTTKDDRHAAMVAEIAASQNGQ